MSILRFPQVGLEVHFGLRDEKLEVRIHIPVTEANKHLQLLDGFKNRLQMLPGMAFFYHHISRIQEAIMDALEGK